MNLHEYKKHLIEITMEAVDFMSCTSLISGRLLLLDLRMRYFREQKVKEGLGGAYIELTIGQPSL